MKTRIYRPTAYNLQRLSHILRQGGLVAVPSETVYGLAANALNSDACAKIFEAKERPTNDPLIIHVGHYSQIQELAKCPDELRKLFDAFWPGPLTVVLNKKPVVPDIVTSGMQSVAVRMPAHPVFRNILDLSGCPLAAPSANPFGYISPTKAQHVKDSLGGKIGYILDGGPCKVGVESTILDFRDPQKPRILRPGQVSADDIEKVLKVRVSGKDHVIVSTKEKAMAPGLLLKHYSPKIKLVLHQHITDEELLGIPKTEAIVLTKARHNLKLSNQAFLLSQSGDLTEIAQNLFSTLRQLDKGRWQCIHCEIPDEKKGLAPAIIDRLTRAAAKF